MPLHCWLASSSARIYHTTPARRSRPLTLDAALNERLSFQVALRREGGSPGPVMVRVDGPAGWAVRTRRVGYVPVMHHNTPIPDDPRDVEGLGVIPGYVPDPLFDEDTVLLPDSETHAFWISVQPAADAVAGDYRLSITVTADGMRAVRRGVSVRLHNVRLLPRQGFPITHWFYADSLIDWYDTDLFDERFWDLLSAYVENIVAHGQDTLYVPVLTPPLDGVKRPTQLLHVERAGSDCFRFGWQDVRRYVKLAKACGITFFEWCHPFTQWGCRHAIRVYEGQGADEVLLWPPETGATSDTYRAFLSQFLTELHQFLCEEDILNKSQFHVSDEPHGAEHLAAYREARELLRELAPWMRVMDALSDIEYGRQGLTDEPVPSIRVALDFVNEGIPCRCYYCCGPRGKYLNHLLDTPLAKIAMHGILFYRWPIHGFLHWGYNYWYESQTRNLIDPYTVQDGLKWPNWAYGDTFLVYPGPDGPRDSIRWEVFAESLQDYQLLQALGVDRDDPVLAPVRSFADFPKTERWRRRLRTELFAMADGR